MTEKNPEIDTLNKEYPVRIVAVVDMLGTSARVRSIGTHVESFRMMKDLFENLANEIHNIETKPGDMVRAIRQAVDQGLASVPAISQEERKKLSNILANIGDGKDEIKCIMMSDTIIMYGPNTEETGFNMIQSLLYFSRHCILQGVLLRGAVVVGPFYHEGTSMFGLGFLKAYHLENQVVDSPRIVVMKPICDNRYLHIDPTGEVGINYDPIIKKSDDGLYHINTFRADFDSRMVIPADGVRSPFFRTVREKLKELLDKAEKIEHWRKIAWITNEFNRTVMAYTEWKIPPIKIGTFDGKL